MTVIFSDDKNEQGSDVDFWGEDYIMSDEPIGILEMINELAAVMEDAVSKEKKHKKVIFKRGNIKGLGKHLAKKYGPQDKGFFTRCMAAEELSGYDEETRKAVCAKAHKVEIGTWPGETPEKKECCSKIRRVRLHRNK